VQEPALHSTADSARTGFPGRAPDPRATPPRHALHAGGHRRGLPSHGCV